MDLEFLKTLYFRELERRAQLDSAPTFRVAVLVLIGSVISYYLQRYTLANNFGAWLFMFCLGAIIFFSTLSILWIVRIYIGFDWEYLPTAKELVDYERALMDYDARFGIDGQTPSAIFKGHLERLLVSAATRNTSNNNTRSEWLYRASLFLSCAVVGTLLAGAPVLFQALASVVGKWEENMSDSKSNPGSKAPNTPPPAPKPPLPPAPQNQIVKGGQTPPKHTTTIRGKH